jgi:alpha-tubulin suppressor-like RCC1 family protein
MPVPGLAGVTAVVSGANHSLALRNDGTLQAWGSNRMSQIGDGTSAANPTPVQVSLPPTVVE